MKSQQLQRGFLQPPTRHAAKAATEEEPKLIKINAKTNAQNTAETEPAKFKSIFGNDQIQSEEQSVQQQKAEDQSYKA